MIEKLENQFEVPIGDQVFVGAELQSLDPRVVKWWRLNWLISVGIVSLFLLAVGVGVGYSVPSVRIWLAIGWLAQAAMGLWFSIWFPPRYYRSWHWRIDARVLELRYGRLVERTRLIPLTRLQHVDLERGPLERLFGLASLVIHTAGTHAANTTIPGLEAEAAVQLRDHLVEIGGDDAV